MNKQVKAMNEAIVGLFNLNLVEPLTVDEFDKAVRKIDSYIDKGTVLIPSRKYGLSSPLELFAMNYARDSKVIPCIVLCSSYRVRKPKSCNFFVKDRRYIVFDTLKKKVVKKSMVMSFESYLNFKKEISR